MKTMKVAIRHNGLHPQVVRVPGGTLTVKPNDRLKDVRILPITPEKLRHYKQRGISFSGRDLPSAEEPAAAAPAPTPKRTGSKRKGSSAGTAQTESEAQNKTTAEAAEAHDRAEDGDDPEPSAEAKDALAVAEEALGETEDGGGAD